MKTTTENKPTTVQSTHTPGPWYVYRAPHGLLHILDVKEPTLNTRQICTFNGSAFWGESEISANARLIAAAPELVLALECALTWMQTHKRLNAVGDDGPLARDISRAELAIAKAKGQP